jgi:two-component system sensor kinase FixL
VALSIGYIALYLVLDRLSFIDALHGIGITPWNPSAGLTLALLIIKGPRWSPAVMAAELLSGATLSEVTIPHAPVFAAALVLASGYGSAAAILSHAGFDAGLRRTSDVVVLLGVTIIGSGLVACGFVAAYAVTGVVPWTGFAEAAFQYWVGDAIGIVVLAPPLLLLNERIKDQIAADRGSLSLRLAEFAAQGVAIVAALAAVFSGMGHPLELFYLLFLPLIWIAMRHGLLAASWAVLAIQIGLIAGLEIQSHSELTLRAFQLLMFALAATGLMLGAVVSERRRLSLALVDSEGRCTAILNTAQDGVLTIDAQGGIQSINPAVERLFSRPSHALIGRDVGELVDAGPDLLHRLRRAARLPVGEARCWELDARRADGSTFPIELSVGRFDLLGTEQYTLVIRDITSRRNAEARAREHQAELAHVSRVSLAGEMAAGLAHELSQPLTAISAYARGCLRLLAGPALEPALLHEGMTEVVQQAERAGNVLDRLREFVRGGECQRALIEVKPVIDAAIDLARIEAMQQGVEIEARIDPGLPAILADRIQIEQVLLNLLRNAVDAMEAANTERRSIVVEARHHRRHAVEISVADSGPGVAAEVTDTIFEPFVTTKPLGMGMGLSISRSIVEWPPSVGPEHRLRRDLCLRPADTRGGSERRWRIRLFSSSTMMPPSEKGLDLCCARPGTLWPHFRRRARFSTITTRDEGAACCLMSECHR